MQPGDLDGVKEKQCDNHVLLEHLQLLLPDLDPCTDILCIRMHCETKCEFFHDNQPLFHWRSKDRWYSIVTNFLQKKINKKNEERKKTTDKNVRLVTYYTLTQAF